MENLKVLALIGARSGSKGVPNKNIRPIAGKPLMAWIIDAAKNAELVDRVVVSTDSEEYAEVARRYGAEVPFLRPKEISSDNSTDIEYILHALDWLKSNENYIPDIVLRLVPTVPMQLSEDIDACIRALADDPEADSAMVVAEALQHPQKAMKLADDGRGGKKLVSYISGSGSDAGPLLRQKYEKAYFRANVVASRLRTIREMNSLSGNLVRYHIIPQDRSIDVDSELDFFIAGKLLERMQKNKN